MDKGKAWASGPHPARPEKTPDTQAPYPNRAPLHPAAVRGDTRLPHLTPIQILPPHPARPKKTFDNHTLPVAKSCLFSPGPRSELAAGSHCPYPNRGPFCRPGQRSHPSPTHYRCPNRAPSPGPAKTLDTQSLLLSKSCPRLRGRGKGIHPAPKPYPYPHRAPTPARPTKTGQPHFTTTTFYP